MTKDQELLLALRERDEARQYAEERNDEANKLQRLLNMAAQERDEARAEVERLREAGHRLFVDELLRARRARELLQRLSDDVTEHAYQELMSVLDDEPLNEQGQHFDALRTVAERQREACAKEAYFYAGLGWSGERNGERIAEMVRATPLVTEGDK